MRTVLCTKVVSQKLFPVLKGTQRFFATDLLSPTLLTRLPASVRAEFASDVFDGPAWRGSSETKRTFAFCFRRSLTEVKQISLAAPHHRKVSAPRPPLSAHSRHHTTDTINSPQEYQFQNQAPLVHWRQGQSPNLHPA